MRRLPAQAEGGGLALLDELRFTPALHLICTWRRLPAQAEGEGLALLDELRRERRLLLSPVRRLSLPRQRGPGSRCAVDPACGLAQVRVRVCVCLARVLACVSCVVWCARVRVPVCWWLRTWAPWLTLARMGSSHIHSTTTFTHRSRCMSSTGTAPPPAPSQGTRASRRRAARCKSGVNQV